ncbi:MAG: GNAT family N-acetyltransferase [Candidatus Portnoybacteria bacterium]|nr:GNAT family N-acetyltransferase [Candidatus Portnoybacteria bacterium]
MSLFNKKSDITFKKATVDNVAEFLRIEKSVAGSKTYCGSVDEQEAREEIENNVVYFIQNKGTNIGTIEYEIKEKDHAYLSGLVVSSNFQGRGIGRKALEWLLVNDLKDFKRIDLATHPHNTRAVILYLSLGFVIESWKDNYFGDGEPRIVLAREI